MIEAGTGVVTITPPLGALLAGMFEERPAVTVERDLTVRSLVIRSNSETIALIVCDLICVPRSIVVAARTRIAESTGIQPENIMVSATHTHSAPAPTPLFTTTPDQYLLDVLPRQIADAVAIAFNNLRPVQIAHGSADTQDVCFNRRFRMKDGTVRFNPGVGNPDIVEVSGPVDPSVSALLVEDLQGIPVALWACCSLHYVGVANSLALSPDYFGEFADVTRHLLGPDCVGFLTNGTSGQVNNVDVRPHDPAPAAVQRRRVATAVASTAVQATMLRSRIDDVAIESTVIPISIVRREILPRDVQLAHRILEAEADLESIGEQFSYVAGQPIPPNQLKQYAREAIELAEWPGSVQSELQSMRIGDFEIVGLPGEIFVEHGLALKTDSPAATTAIVSLANDYVGYIPTIAAFSEGGYETWAAKSASAAPGSGESMVQTITQHWNRSGSDMERSD